MAEWLRRQPAKLMGYARVGSNPTVVVYFSFASVTAIPSANGVSVTLKLPKLSVDGYN